MTSQLYQAMQAQTILRKSGVAEFVSALKKQRAQLEAFDQSSAGMHPFWTENNAICKEMLDLILTRLDDKTLLRTEQLEAIFAEAKWAGLRRLLALPEAEPDELIHAATRITHEAITSDYADYLGDSNVLQAGTGFDKARYFFKKATLDSEFLQLFSAVGITGKGVPAQAQMRDFERYCGLEDMDEVMNQARAAFHSYAPQLPRILEERAQPQPEPEGPWGWVSLVKTSRKTFLDALENCKMPLKGEGIYEDEIAEVGNLYIARIQESLRQLGTINDNAIQEVGEIIFNDMVAEILGCENTQDSTHALKVLEVCFCNSEYKTFLEKFDYFADGEEAALNVERYCAEHDEINTAFRQAMIETHGIEGLSMAEDQIAVLDAILKMEEMRATFKEVQDVFLAETQGLLPAAEWQRG